MTIIVCVSKMCVYSLLNRNELFITPPNPSISQSYFNAKSKFNEKKKSKSKNIVHHHIHRVLYKCTQCAVIYISLTANGGVIIFFVKNISLTARFF